MKTPLLWQAHNQNVSRAVSLVVYPTPVHTCLLVSYSTDKAKSGEHYGNKARIRVYLVFFPNETYHITKVRHNE